MDDKSAEGSAGYEGTDHSEQVKGMRAVERAERGTEERSRAGEVGDRLMFETDQADYIHDAGSEREGPGPSPNPTWKLVDHAHMDTWDARLRDLNNQAVTSSVSELSSVFRGKVRKKSV